MSVELRQRGERKLQVVGTRGAILGGQNNGGGVSSGLRGHETTFTTHIGPSAVYDVRPLYSNIVAGGAGVEAAGPNDIRVSGAIVDAALTKVRGFTFNGGVQSLIKPGQWAIPDRTGLDHAAYTQLQIKTGVAVAADGAWPQTDFTGPNNNLAFNDDSAVTDDTRNPQVLSTSAMTLPSGGAQVFIGYIPTCVLGYAEEYMPAIAIVDDSIGAGTVGGESIDTTTGARGLVARALWDVAKTTPLPYSMLARASELASWLTDFDGAFRKSLLDYHTHMICGLGTNDIGGGASLATLQARVVKVWNAGKRRGLKVAQRLILPRTQASNTQPVAGYEPGGIRDQFNQWCIEGGAGILDGVANANVVADSGNNDGLWAAGISTDLTHPNAVGHAALAVPIRDFIDTFIR